MPRYRDEPPIVQCLVGLRLDQVGHLDSVCRQRNLSRSEIVREAVDEWLMNHSGRKHAGDVADKK